MDTPGTGFPLSSETLPEISIVCEEAVWRINNAPAKQASSFLMCVSFSCIIFAPKHQAYGAHEREINIILIKKYMIKNYM